VSIGDGDNLSGAVGDRTDGESFRAEGSARESVSGENDNEFFIRRTLEHDPIKGYELLYRNYYGPLCSHAARFVHNNEVAEDLVSDVFFHVWNGKLHNQIKTSFRAYLFTAVRNKCLTYLKWEFDKENTQALSNDAVSSDLQPDRIMEYDDLYLLMEKSLSALPPQCQKVFMMSRSEGKSYQEIASKLNISSKAVEAHVSKALTLLRKALKEIIMFAVIFSMGSGQ
jgi:RNA polymerase sigma-70 factor (family 1)